jgi:ABC-2 type transport system permease protein
VKGFWKLTWIEIKVFAREPLGLFGSLGVPVLIYVFLSSAFDEGGPSGTPGAGVPFNVPVAAALFIAISAVISLVAIVSIYREGGILKRLRATPLSPLTILCAHVAVKLLFTAATLALLVLAGRRLFPGAMDVDVASFAGALLLSTLSILSMGFIIASVVPTARFAQPIGAAFLYPMIAISGLFYPVERMGPALRGLAYALPTTHAVALMEGIWNGEGWAAHWMNVVGLVAAMVVCSAIATRVFRWE